MGLSNWTTSILLQWLCYNFSLLFLKERCPKGREVNYKTAKPHPNPSDMLEQVLLKNERELVYQIIKRECIKSQVKPFENRVKLAPSNLFGQPQFYCSGFVITFLSFKRRDARRAERLNYKTAKPHPNPSDMSEQVLLKNERELVYQIIKKRVYKKSSQTL
ncbi:hypothetical protein ACR777_16170 [Sphingobacterium spiritivorum]|uniref:hypothetical protein n=1 Tax=Sphingobacterium spiritivorum TaxID=258 RepID=UPI003DA407E8